MPFVPGGAAVSATSSAVLISTLTPTGTTADFTSIPATYTHLEIRWYCHSDGVSADLAMKFNADGGANYDWLSERIYLNGGDGTDGFASTAFSRVARVTGTTSFANYAGGGTIWIPDYSATNYYKTFVALSSYINALTTTNIGVQESSGSWRSSAAINRITLTLGTGNFVNSTLSLWGYSA